ncbi:MAG: AMP-dependent synthetase/ligase [Saccharofermentanales bacterium]|jgi:long-chain acyl-CoA synthetase|nr:AMP-binding protein [Clostridiaceae bacterium]
MKNKNYPLYETTIFENIRVMVENVAKKYPDRVAISYKINPHDAQTVDVTYLQARNRVRALGTGLIAMNLRDRHIALIGDATYDWVCSYFALMAIGAVVVPLDRDLPAEEIADILTRAKCEGVIYHPAIESKIKDFQSTDSALPTVIAMGQPKEITAIPIEDVVTKGQELLDQGDSSYDDYTIDDERMATIVFTSGTTGKGKGVMLSQKNIVLDMTNGMYNFAITPKTINTLPPHHTFCSTVIFVGHFSQGSTIYLSSGLRHIGAEIKEQQPTHLILVPLFLEKLAAKIWSGAEESGKANLLRAMIKVSNFLRKFGIDLRRKLFKSVLAQLGGKLELVISGGAALKQDIIDTFDSLGITILNGYGITECSPLVSCNRNKYQKRGSVGCPIIDEEIKILNPDENGEGEICVKGPNVMLGYYEDPEATAAAFDEEGFFRTGDFGKLDEEGWLYITGRLKNIIVLSNGKNVYPEEIELKISQVPGVEEVIVYAGESRSQKSKEVIVAEIFPNQDALQSMGVTDPQKYFDQEIRKINGTMVAYKAVNLVRLRDSEFEKNTSRKIMRFQIDKSID